MIDAHELPIIEGVNTTTVMGGMLGRLALRMQTYDTLQQKLAIIDNEAEQFNEQLNDLDSSLNARDYTEDIAYNALGLVLANKRLDPIKRDLDDLWDQGSLDTPSLYGRKATVKVHDPSKLNLIRGYKIDKHGEALQGLAKGYQVLSGRIDDYRFDHTNGGWLELMDTWRNRVYAIRPLIFRDENGVYKPSYDIELT